MVDDSRNGSVDGRQIDTATSVKDRETKSDLAVFIYLDKSNSPTISRKATLSCIFNPNLMN